MDEVIEEIKRKSPNLWKVLSTIMDYDLCPTKKMAPMCMIYGIIMFGNCHELSRIQRINAILLMQGQATTQVTIQLYSFILFTKSSGIRKSKIKSQSTQDIHCYFTGQHGKMYTVASFDPG